LVAAVVVVVVVVVDECDEQLSRPPHIHTQKRERDWERRERRRRR